jgi:hypothetical protein
MPVHSSRPQGSASAQPDSPRAIAKEAYLYAFAMLENYQTMYKQAVDSRGTGVRWRLRTVPALRGAVYRRQQGHCHTQ